MFNKFLNFINDGKNFYNLFFFLVVFLCLVKLPPLFSTDIQPWDEGMYATRVLSIHINNDFVDQSSHSIGQFYSGSHPPLLIWTGYFFTLLFGINAPSLKIIPFILSLLCLLMIMLIGRKFFDIKTGFFGALIFSSNIIFNVFSKRFQFDIPYTFLILLSFYLFLLYRENKNVRYNILGGTVFGLCLMVKILVGFFIPGVIFLFLLSGKKISGYSFKDLIIFTATGILIALPWHIYMIAAYGREFLDYFFYYHIFERAFTGVEHNEKGSGILYHINYYLSIIPFGITVFLAFAKDIRKYKSLSAHTIFCWIWFLSGLIIISLFKTKLEVYVLLILTPSVFLIAEYFNYLKDSSLKEKAIAAFLTFLNIFWFATLYFRANLKSYFLDKGTMMIVFITAVIVFSIVYYISRLLARKENFAHFYFAFAILFFIASNIYFLVRIPEWENNYVLTSVKDKITESKRNEIIYVSNNFRANPQFSFYFEGLNIGWKSGRYSYKLIDTKDGTEKVKSFLGNLEKSRYNIIVEGDNINRSVYPDPKLFLPENFKLITKTGGYELYEN